MTPSATPLSRPDGSALRVLVVDDEQMLTDLLSMALKMEGWDVRTAGSGFDALTLARDFDPDAVVLDVMMPDLDGMAVPTLMEIEVAEIPESAVADCAGDARKLTAAMRAKIVAAAGLLYALLAISGAAW